ncbi:site-specific recombinase XerD [Kribbella orskensis]|uniref:Site-specific recombinase XerD n=1 Tax=Kribbella orskensis TaxID=2512216 RepID=A0ABY2BPF1_9ACTN|nr:MULTISPECIES: tyrosine-type recombinase/integrase [Kribbella]TCN39842.1 site-specific recombinase XerD [Kribbella sp. VKM Ac-2500]TCO27375.1 site-specific recombinase XerD [Kribbella orskensis]
METTFDVRISEELQVNKLAKGKKSYTVRWRVAKEPFSLTRSNKTLAKNERSKLVSAVGRGEAFYTDTGRPISEARALNKVTFYDFACEYVDMKWPRAAANSRRSIADALVAVTPVMLKGRKTGADAKALRKALHRWAFNSAQRESAPDDVRALLKWAAASSKPLADLAKPDTIRAVLDAVGSKLDGKAASVTYTARRRAVLWNLCEFAVEKKHLAVNPITTIKWARPKVHNADVVDPATVPNPQQAKALLTAVGELPGSGPRMVAFFASMYYSALRPGEAVDLTKSNLHIPDEGRGKLYLTGSNPFAGSAWTDSGENRDQRGLKHREEGAGRWAPCPPELTEILHDHLNRFGTTKEGLMFWGQRGGTLPGKTYQAMWKAARAAAFGEEVARTSRLAERPYDLRHAAVSTWLASGVDPQRVADWAGHSLEVLMRVYAKCLDGEEDQAMDRIEAKLRGE